MVYPSASMDYKFVWFFFCFLFILQKLIAYLIFIQVMTCRPRSDLCINLPALRKLDNMLIVRTANHSYV